MLLNRIGYMVLAQKVYLISRRMLLIYLTLSVICKLPYGLVESLFKTYIASSSAMMDFFLRNRTVEKEENNLLDNHV